MRTEKIEFAGHSGQTLAARLDLPDDEPRAYALFAHCFTCSKDLAAARRVSTQLTQSGVAVLRFDFTGLGHSEGEFANTHFSSNVDDLMLAAQWLRENRAAPEILVGHSLGGAAVIAAAPDLPEVRAVATIGAPADPEHVLKNFGAALDVIRSDGEAEVSLAGRRFRIRREFIEDAEVRKLESALGRLGAALLVLHAPRDEIVGIENASQIFLAARHPKSFVSLDDADHLVTGEADAAYAADVIAAWASRYVSSGPEERHPAAGVGEGKVRSAEVDASGFLQDVHAGKHHMLADEPASVGGADRGPSPYQFLTAALATCTSMTVRMYARRKGIALEHIFVDVSHDRIHARDCEDCETSDGHVDVFQREIRLVGALTDAERAKLLEIADKCPVHRTLEREIKVRTAAI